MQKRKILDSLKKNKKIKGCYEILEAKRLAAEKSISTWRHQIR